MSSKKAIIARIWERILGRPFSLEEFVGFLALYGGYDMHDLSKDELAALVEDRFDGDWREPEFSFQEIAGYFAASFEMSEEIDPEQIVCWVGSVLITGELVRRGHTDWEGWHLDMFLKCFQVMQKKLDGNEIVYVLAETFRGA